MRTRAARQMVAALALALALAGAVQANPPRVRSTGPDGGTGPVPARTTGSHFTEAIALRSALQRAARAFFPIEIGELVRVKRVRSEAAYEAACELEMYEAIAAGDRLLGSFVRLRVLLEETTIDLALRFEDGRLADVAALHPVMLHGRALLGLPAFLRELPRQPVEGYAPELAALFDSLLTLGRASAGQDEGRVYTTEQEQQLKAAVKAQTPSLAPGTPMPAFSLADLQGRTLSPARFAGSRALVMVGMVQTGKTRQLMEWLQRYTAQRAGRFVLAEILVEEREHLEQFRIRGGTFAGAAAADPEGKVQAALHVTFMPSLLAFDRGTRLLQHLEPPFTSYEALAAELDSLE